jgi:hypothetical protein
VGGGGGGRETTCFPQAPQSRGLFLSLVRTLAPQVDLAGSDFDTTLAVFTGATVNALTLVASNDNCNSVAFSYSCLAFEVGAAMSGCTSTRARAWVRAAAQGHTQPCVPAVCLLSACCLPAVCLLSACCLPAVCLLSACCLLAVCLL